MAATVTTPSTPDEAAAAFAADPAATIVGGGTVVVPANTLGTRVVDRAIWLGRAGLDLVESNGGTVTIGAAASLAACAALGAPVGSCAANIGDGELRAQATLGGNICSPAPLGDLRGPLLALEAEVRSSGPDGESAADAASFFADGAGRLVLGVTYTEPAAGAFVPLHRHHTQSLTALAISAVRTADGEVRLAATGAAPDARRLGAAEAALAGGASAADAADAALQDAETYDDALASAAYRQRVLPILVRRAIEQLGG